MKPSRVPDDLIQAGFDAIRAWCAANPDKYLDDRTQMRIVLAAALTLHDQRAEERQQLRAQGSEYGIDATRLTQIRDRSQRLAEIPFDHHDDANHIVTDLIDSAADVKWLIKQLDQTRTDLVRTKRELDRRLGPVGDRD